MSDLPQNPQAERALLSCILIDYGILSLTNAKRDWFYGIENQKIFDAMLSIQKENQIIDAISINAKSNVDMDYIFDIQSELLSSMAWKTYEDILLECYTKRKLLKMANEIQGSISTSSTDEVFIKMKKLLNSMDDRDTGANGYELLVDTIADITTKQNNICDYQYPLLDKYLGGYKEGQLIVIGGRPGFGKTALIIELLQRILQQGKKVTVYSLEMSNEELVKRLLSNWTEIPSQLLSKDENQNKIAEKAEPKADIMKNAMFYDKIFDFEGLERSIRRGSIVQGHNVVFIDHLGLIKTNLKTVNRNQEIGYITASLKTLAKELGIAIVVLSQLNRNVEKRNDEPELSDLRDSGSIEQDADVVMMLHREKDMDGHYDNSQLDILIRKNRNGNLVRIQMNTDMKTMRIVEAPLKRK